MPKQRFAQIENKNALIELLEDNKPISRLIIANNAYKDVKTKRIVELAREQGIPIERRSRKSISRKSRTSSTESVMGFMIIENQITLEQLLSDTYARDDIPFFLILNEIRYPQNLGAIFRTAFAAGVNGIITSRQTGNLLSDEIIRISMGTALRLPLVETHVFNAIKRLQKDDIKVYAMDMDGKSIYKQDLKGPVAFVLGSEDTGVSSKVLERVNGTLAIPMRKGLGSLNVSASAAIIAYEKLRQELAG